MTYIFLIKKIQIILLLITTFASLTSNASTYGDYKCFIEPMDKYPENRVNVLPSIGNVYVLHVALSDRKTLLSDPLEYSITKQKLITNMEAHVISTGIFAVDKYKNDYGKHNGIYYHNDDGNEDGYIYSCERVKLIRD
jgi:hypothetical protein